MNLQIAIQTKALVRVCCPVCRQLLFKACSKSQAEIEIYCDRCKRVKVVKINPDKKIS